MLTVNLSLKWMTKAKKKKNYAYIYVICRLGGPYGEKL